MEWTETEISWFFDDKPLFYVNLTKKLQNNYNPFGKPFKLVLSVGVGGRDFNQQILTAQDADEWPCPLLIIDYVRVYQELGNTNNALGENEKISFEICEKVMPIIRKGINDTELNARSGVDSNGASSMSLLAIISISSFLLLLAIIPLIIFMFIRMKKTQQAIADEAVHNKMEELYDEAVMSEHFYSNPYEPTTENYYAQVATNYHPDENRTEYIVMTNKYTKPF